MTTEELIAARRAEPWREALRKSKKNKERTDIPRVEMNELDAEYRSPPRRGKPRIDEGAGHGGSPALSGLSESDLYARMSGKYQYPDVCEEHRAGRVSGSGQSAEGNKCIAGCLRPCMSAGKTVRKQVHSSEDG